MKIQKKKIWGVGVGSGGGRVGGGGGGGRGRCELRSEAFVKIKKNIFFFLFFWGGGPVRGVRLGGVRVDGNGELKLL